MMAKKAHKQHDIKKKNSCIWWHTKGVQINNIQSCSEHCYMSRPSCDTNRSVYLVLSKALLPLPSWWSTPLNDLCSFLVHVVQGTVGFGNVPITDVFLSPALHLPSFQVFIRIWYKFGNHAAEPEALPDHPVAWDLAFGRQFTLG
jgi:hypothetical protein